MGGGTSILCMVQCWSRGWWSLGPVDVGALVSRGCETITSLLLFVVWESSSAFRWELAAVDTEVNQCRLSKYYPFLWTIITLLIYVSACCSLKTQFHGEAALAGYLGAQTVALGHDGSGDGSDGSRVYEAYCWKMDTMTSRIWEKWKIWIPVCQRQDEQKGVCLYFSFFQPSSYFTWQVSHEHSLCLQRIQKPEWQQKESNGHGENVWTLFFLSNRILRGIRKTEWM